ncbi:uncharacterized protein LOC111099117 [Crassostrea virginica]|uniref:Uncharacterized protein LOC111099117 n=1 Tax=Crassostrea virginica TaxID=6565 RepID=A0A8B8A687_CRAVI|nr:uncharacterized protein LOC111099117 [Crassostrea virginica]
MKMAIVVFFLSLCFLLTPISRAVDSCKKNECTTFDGRCLSVNQTNKVCRDVEGACRNVGEHWNHTNCFTVKCRGPEISVVSNSCVDIDGECTTMGSGKQLCRDQFGRCRANGSRWNFRCFDVTCQNGKVEVLKAKCCIRDSQGCIMPLDCRSPGDIWTVPGIRTPQTCEVTRSAEGRYSFRYFNPPK